MSISERSHKNSPRTLAHESWRASPPVSDAQHETPYRTQRSLVRADLERITDRFDSADRRAKRVATILDREAAEDERREAAADFWAAEEELVDLFLMLLRLSVKHQPDALRLYLAELVGRNCYPSSKPWRN